MFTHRVTKKGFVSSQELAASITRTASKQSYYTVRFLVDGDLVPDAYRAYAYFRWLDDHLDQAPAEKHDRVAFVERQKAVMEGIYRGDLPDGLTAEERMLADLVQVDQEKHSGLQAYLRNMMAVMVFDADRRGGLVSQRELDRYTRSLAIAVTEALHYFIGHDESSPQDARRYLAATGAHIAHMLRDTLEDCEAGYFNIPREYLEAHAITPCDVDSGAYRAWVQKRVKLARACFKSGKDYLSQVENTRCRIAGYAYIARFESVLDAIEKQGYRLQSDYKDYKTLAAGMSMVWSAVSLALNANWQGSVSPASKARRNS